MGFYSIIVLVHVIAAVVGLGATFALPAVMSSPRTAAQARYSMDLNVKIEVFAKVGSITLLITGIALGFLQTDLFTQGWYITSLILFIIVEIIVIGIIPKKMKGMAEILESHKGEDIPSSYKKASQQLRPYNAILHGSAVVLIILMSIKPF